MTASAFWSVVQTEPLHEHVVRLLLMRERFETYAPRIKHRQRIALLFPSYLFVRVIERWHPIRWTPGVVQLLMTGDQPARLCEHVVTSIRARERDGFVRLPKPPATFKPGQRVRIVRGSFEGQFAIYQGMSGRERERVLLDLLGQKVPVNLPTANLAALTL